MKLPLFAILAADRAGTAHVGEEQHEDEEAEEIVYGWPGPASDNRRGLKCWKWE
jgi:hypothetical protein